VSDTVARVDRKGGASIDLVHVRDVLSALAAQEQSEPLLAIALGTLTQCKDVIEAQAYEIAMLRKQLFGRRSEKVSPNQLHLFASLLEALVPPSPEDAAPPSTAEPSPEPKPKKKRPPQKRRPLIPTQTVNLPVPEAERPCPKCGGERDTIGHDRSVVIEYTPPKIDVREYRREKLACKPCEGEITRAPAPAEKVVEGALPGPRMLAALTVNKLVDRLPLHGTQRMFARHGPDLPVQTLNRWEGYGYTLSFPVIGAIRRGVLGADTINLDDTGLRVRDRGVETGITRGHVWVFVGRYYDPGGDLSKTVELVYYFYAPTWEARYPEEFLKGCKAVLQGDAYRGYDRISEPKAGEVKNLLAGCCMHARRPFARALEMRDPLAPFFIGEFQALYRVEAQAKERALTVSQRLELRQEHSRPILERIRSRAEELDPLPLTTPMREGVRYLQNQWERLLVPFERDGRLEIDNGIAERRLRRLASGRRVWLFAGSPAGAERIAHTLSLVSTADAAGVDPGRYLADLYQRIAAGWPQRRLEDLLPHRWKQLLEHPQ
jgi:transposase